MSKEYQYMEEYDTFMKEFKLREVAPEEVGLLITKMSQYYGKLNLERTFAARKLALVAQDIESREDEDTGKNISNAKAKVYVAATDEAYEYEMANCHVLNAEQYINSLKSLLKALLNEYSHMSNT